MKTYSWNFDEHDEYWCNDTFDTIEECLYAQKENLFDGAQHSTIYIGQNVPFVPSVDIESVLDNYEEQASDECGQVGHDWNAYNNQKRDELEELRAALDIVLHDWMRKYGYYPKIYSIQNIKAYPLEAPK